MYYKGAREQTYFSWVNKSGDMMVSAYDHETGIYTEKLLYPKLEVDDHDNPAIFIRKDGRLVVYFSKHTTAPAHRFISSNPEDITSWGNDYQFGVNVTYPYPFQVGDQIYVFYRGLDWHPTLVISDDDGETMGTPRQFIAGGGSRPYARYCQDNAGTIHVAFTTGHPRDVANNKIYYAQFKDGKFYKADGTFIKEFTGTETALNIDQNEAETVYDAAAGKGWIWDITVDEHNNPVLVYASFPTDTDHRYHYARWTGTEWFRKELTKAGKWFPQTPAGASEPEPNYSGGIILDYNDPSVVYLSKQVKGVFEIFKYTTPDKGITWDSTAITWNTPAHLVNVRPIVPRNHKPGCFDVVWMRGTYQYYTNYNTSLVFSAPVAGETLNAIAFDVESMEMKKSISRQINVSFIPFLTTNKSLVWTSSDENVAVVANGLVTAIAPGTAIITAIAYNGVKTTCLVNVSEPNYVANIWFDFGTSTSPVATGAVQITESTLITDSYGWTDVLWSRDRGSSASDELRDFNMSSEEKTFKIFVRPGAYRITTKQGDLSYAHDNMNLYVNGEPKLSNVYSGINSYTTNTFDVNTANDFLELTFSDGGGSDANWVINSLKIEAQTVTALPKTESSPIPSAGTMRVYDMSGRMIWTENLNGTPYLYLLANRRLRQGVYLVKIAYANQTESIKHIVD
ncbi:MAG: BNR-4 repeat-containing protein [Breznakibacter sp.]